MRVTCMKTKIALQLQLPNTKIPRPINKTREKEKNQIWSTWKCSAVARLLCEANQSRKHLLFLQNHLHLGMGVCFYFVHATNTVTAIRLEIQSFVDSTQLNTLRCAKSFVLPECPSKYYRVIYRTQFVRNDLN